MIQLVLATSVMLILGASAAPAQSLSDRAIGARTGDTAMGRRDEGPGQPGGATLLLLFDRDIVKGLNEAWQRASAGTTLLEAVVLIVRSADGSCNAILPAPTNESRRFTFRWQPGTVAILHTHPNRSDPRPHAADVAIADRLRVPMFTLTVKGMFLYDPAKKTLSKVHDGVDWLDYSKWRRYAPPAAPQLAIKP